MGGAAVSQEGQGEPPDPLRAAPTGDALDRCLDAVLPIFFMLDGERGVCGAKEIPVEPRVVAPAVSVRVDEDSAVNGRRVGGLDRAEVGRESRFRVCKRRVEGRVPERLYAKEELGDKVVVVS